MKISIVIPAHNAGRSLDRLLQSCLNQAHSLNGTEIIVVDDGSTDKTADIVRSYPDIKYIYQENKGPAAARNKGWKEAEGDIICFTDSDCIPEKNWIAKILGNYTSDDIGGVGGGYELDNRNSILAKLIHEEIIFRHARMPKFVDYLGSFNVSYRKNVLEETGGFDETYKKASGEDNDLAYRVKSKGYKLIFDKDIKVAHNYPVNLLKYLRQQFNHGFWRVKLYLFHTRMIKGDCYSNFFDYIQPPMALLTVFLYPFSFFSHIFKNTALFALLVLFIMQLAMAVSIAQKKRKIECLLLAPLTFIRNYMRGLGMFFGLLSFIGGKNL